MGNTSRRQFLKSSVTVGACAGIGDGLATILACRVVADKRHSSNQERPRL